MVSGFWPTALMGVVGALIAELIRILPLIRKQQHAPSISVPELLVSLAYCLIGGGAVLLGWSDPQRAFSVAVLGAAFPSVFSNAVRSAGPPQRTSRGPVARRSLLDYAAGRF